MKLRFKLDKWQKDFLETEGDKILCCGRQIGKSEICGIDAGEYAVNNPKKVVLMIAPTERQAFALFDKTLMYLGDNYPSEIKKGKDRPTKTKINLKNGTKIYCLPTGISGIGIRFLTVHRLYRDEASRIPREVGAAVGPMLLTTGGADIQLSTPYGKDNEFADIVMNKNQAYDSYTRFSATSETVIRERPLCDSWTEEQRDKALEYLQRAEKRMSALEYAQEYKGELVDELRQFFPTELIKSAMAPSGGSVVMSISTNTLDFSPAGFSNYLGVDVARMGADDTVLYGVQDQNGTAVEIELNITSKTYLTETVQNIKRSDRQYNYKKIFVDTTGMGFGVYDPLLDDPQTKRKVVSIENASRSISNDGTRRKKLLKEDLYNNLLHMMEEGKVKLKSNDDTFHSLKSVQAEYTGNNLRIFGNNTHITEALIRAVWGIKTKSLNIYIY